MKTDKQGSDSTASPESTGNVFSRMIPPPVSRDALTIIEHYCRLRAIGPLGPNRVRLFQQPMGFVGQAVEVDLSSRNMTVYPGTHAKQHVFHGTLSSRQVDLLRALLTSDELSRAPADASQAASFDGASYVLELSLADKYAWFLHRDPKDFWLIEVIRHIEALAWEAQHPGTRFLVR